MPATGAESFAVATMVNTPIQFFGVMAIVCCSVFGVAAAYLKDREVFMWCIHMYLAVLGVLVVTAVSSPASLYHPAEIAQIPVAERPANRPGIPTASVFVAIVLYMVYIQVNWWRKERKKSKADIAANSSSVEVRTQERVPAQGTTIPPPRTSEPAAARGAIRGPRSGTGFVFGVLEVCRTWPFEAKIRLVRQMT